MNNSMGVQFKNSDLGKMRFYKNRYHTKTCLYYSGNEFSPEGECKRCDELRVINLNKENKQQMAVSFGLSMEKQKDLYCNKAFTKFARCTKVTFPSCGCGRLVLNQNKEEGMRYY